MTDKYSKLRQDLAAAIADAKRQGGVNERAEQIAELLAERGTLAAAPVSAEPVGYVSRDASIARMTTNLPEGSPLYAAPVPSQPDLTQQTLDDVMAGIPARDAEIAALRKQVETLQAQLVDRSPEMQGTPVDESSNLQSQKQPVSGADGLADYPTHGMNLGQRIAHVGGRENAQGYVEFGSPMAVHALIQHVLRDFHRQGRVSLAPAKQDADKVDAALAEMVHAMFRSGNSVPVTRITIDRKQYEAAIDAARKEQA